MIILFYLCCFILPCMSMVLIDVIDLELDLREMLEKKKLYFNATAQITMKVENSSDNVILLHAFGLKFSNQTTFVCSKRSIPAQIVHRYSKEDSVALYPKEPLRQGERCRVQLEYSSDTVPFRGLYHSFYPHAYDANHTTAVIGEFHQLLARRIVPCIDAPASVHKWRVTVLHPFGSTAYFSSKRAFLRTEKEYHKTIFREFISAPYRLNFALIWDREYRIRKIQTRSGKTINLRFPIKMDFNYSRLLSTSAEVFDFFYSKFGAPFESENLDVLIAQHLEGGSVGGSLMILDHIEALKVPRLRQYMAMLWLQQSDYRLWKDGWFIEGLTSYFGHFLDIPKERWLNTSQSLYQIRQISENPLITAPFVHYPNEYDSVREQRRVFQIKGPMLFHMIERIIGPDAFYRAIQEILRSKIFQEHKIIDQIWKNSAKYRAPECFRVFIRSYAQQSHLPVLKISLIPGNRVQIQREAYNAPNDLNILWRPFQMYAYYTVPLFEADDNLQKPLKWLDQSVDDVIIPLDNFTLPLDPYGHGMYFIQYIDPRLAPIANVTNCDLQQRLCIPEGLNYGLCNGSCPSEHEFEKFYHGTKHPWDEY